MLQILFISPQSNPFININGGSAQRTNLLLKACASVGAVDVVTLDKNVKSNIEHCNVVYVGEYVHHEKKRSRLDKFKEIVSPWDIYSFFKKDNQLCEMLQRILEKKNYDYIVTRYIPKAMMWGLYDYADKLVIDVDDMPADVLESTKKDAKSFRSKLWYSIAIHIANLHCNRLLSKVKSCSFPNAEQVKLKNAYYLPNIPYYTRETNGVVEFANVTKTVLFVGDLTYIPNIYSVSHFVENIWPLVLKKNTDAQFNIIGKVDKVQKNKWAKYCNVNVLGFVDDLIKEYENCRVVVVPMYRGAGTNIKFLEAIQMNRPVVASKYATRGFNSIFIIGQDCHIASSAAEYADKIDTLLNNEQLNHSMAISSKKKLLDNFSVNSFNSVVAKMLS